MERKKIGIIINSKCKGNIEQRVIIAYADNADFCTSGENSDMKMQEIVSYYMKMHKATGGKVQKEKVSVNFWRWKDNKIINETIELKLKKEEVINKMKVNISIKTLGVCANPMLDWKDQF